MIEDLILRAHYLEHMPISRIARAFETDPEEVRETILESWRLSQSVRAALLGAILKGEN